MYSMKEACALTDMTYENLKFYCNEGLVPNVKRDGRNYRVFDDHDIKWIQSLNCLKNCGMSIAEMKEYLALCLEGERSIPERKTILERKKEALLQSIEQLQQAVADKVPYLYLYSPNSLFACQKTIENLHPADFAIANWDVWNWKVNK